MITLIILIITVFYLVLIGSLVVGFDKVERFNLSDKKPTLKFSVVIPFRDEAKNLSRLLASLEALKYPKSMFEVILVNDESTDGSVAVIQTFSKSSNLQIRFFDTVRTTESPKKDAVTLAISKANYEWIVSTDADCEVPNYWLDAYDEFITSQQLKMVIGPVMYAQLDSFLKRFQALDVLSLQGSSMGGFGIKKPFLCNAANMAYQKRFFDGLNGFQGNADIASGDDIFLLQKALKAAKDKIGYLKSELAVVNTKSEDSWNNLFNQRRRWASKTRHYRGSFGKLAGMMVFLMNGTLICAVLLAFVGMVGFEFLGYIIVIKLLIDFLLLYKSARFFDKESLLASYLFAGILYPFFVVGVAFSSMFRDFRWKGRRFSK